MAFVGDSDRLILASDNLLLGGTAGEDTTATCCLPIFSIRVNFSCFTCKNEDTIGFL